MPDVAGSLQDLMSGLGPWTYALVAVFAALETAAFAGLVLPGETLIVLGGVAAERGDVTLLPLLLIVWTAAVAGDAISFALGRRLGRRFLERHGARVGVSPPRLVRIDRFFAEHGGAALLIGRFVGLIRAFAPLMAGSAGTSYRRVAPFSVAGAGVWVAAFTLVGYTCSASLRSANDVVTFAGAGAAAVAIAVAGITMLRRRRIAAA
jgi:membrane protein DedA with SNARE-associated domain